jgi:hypothetical protein
MRTPRAIAIRALGTLPVLAASVADDFCFAIEIWRQMPGCNR